jgi:hypothetical protein
LDISCNNFEDNRQVLALKLFSTFGVRTPALSATDGGDIIREVNGFVPLDPTFFEEYKNQSKNGEAETYFNYNYSPLVGFGQMLAVSILLDNYDCFGNNFGNVGYIQENSYLKLVMYDAGESLSFEKEVDSHTNPIDRSVRLYSNKDIFLKFSELNKLDQQDFIMTVKTIFDYPHKELSGIFEEFIKKDPKFEDVLNSLEKRKQLFIESFSDDLRRLIQRHINIMNQQFAEMITKTGK